MDRQRLPTTTTTSFDHTPAPRKRLTFNQGSSFFRQRLALSLLSSRPVKITDIRSNSDISVGLRPHEVSFIRLISTLSNGTKVKISETGTELQIWPGVLTGGPVDFETDPSRPLSYYLEPVLLLAPFCKQPLVLNLKGRLQNGNGYNSAYKIKYSGIPLLKSFGLSAEVELTSRSSSISSLKFTCSIRRQLRTLRQQYSDFGKVKKIRGLAYGFRVSPQLLNRIVTTAKGSLIKYLSDVYITTDQVKRSKSKEPGYGLVLYAETTRGVVHAEDGFVGREQGEDEDNVKAVVSGASLLDGGKRKFDIFNEEAEEQPSKDKKPRKETKVETFGDGRNDQDSTPTTQPSSPESLACSTSRQLLHSLRTRSCVDPCFQYLVLALMALGPRDVSSVTIGELTPFTIQYLRDLRSYFGVTFRVEEVGREGDGVSCKLYRLSCLGSGYINLNKTMI